MKKQRIGIYAGTFDPVHAGHIGFALQSLSAAKLDKVYFMPERRPRAKQQVEHFGHRVAMLTRALRPYPEFAAIELVDVSFSVERMLPKLLQMFEGNELIFLFGSDVIPSLADWPYAMEFVKGHELVVALRFSDDRKAIHKIVETWKTEPKAITIFPSFAPKISSDNIREALRRNQTAKGLLKSVERYSDHNWLYISLA
jgi:nicotinate-nucleotide adenylyltransferase